jgi:CHAT domain-containing protein
MKGDLGGAERLVRTAIHDLESANYGYGPDYALHFNTLSTIYKERGDLERADSLSRRSIEILSKEQQGAHPFMPRLYNGLAWIRIDRGDPEGAITLFEQARARNSRLHAPSHPEVVGNLTSLGQARILVGGESLEKAETTLADAAARYDEARLLVGRSTKRATQRLASPYPALASVQLLQGKEEAAWASVEGSLSRTLADLLLAADERHLTDAEEAREDSLKNLLSRLEADVENLKQPAAETAAPGSEAERNLDEAWTRLLAAQAAWTRHEQQVSDRHPLTEGHAWSRDRIQSVMEDRTAIVGWLDIEIGQAWNRTWGYVLCKGGPVHWVLLPSSKSSIEDYRKAMHAASEWPVSVALGAKDRERAEALFVERILPLLPFLENVESLVVIPSGPMLGIPVEAFRDGNGQWLSDRFSVSYAPSGTIYGWLREKTLRRPAHVRSSALVLGDPIFARSPQPREPETPNSSMSGPKQPASRSEDLVPSGVPSTLTSVWQPDVLFRSAVTGNREALDGLPRLPRTRTEAAGVAACFWKHQLLLGSEASEQALNALARSGALADFDILHFATHALPDDAQPERSALVLSRDRLDDPVSEILSGGPFYDGLLTAGEIMRDWKLDADLVTLSGCRTGLGYRVPGEGYLGLAHAFFQAGSRSMLVSLWDVEDRATALLMHRFYENMTGSFEGARAGLRGRAMGKAEALREAKSWLRELPDDAGALPYAHPAFWSAFVLVGEP